MRHKLEIDSHEEIEKLKKQKLMVDPKEIGSSLPASTFFIIEKKEWSLKKLESYTSCMPFFYHGIGLDLTKLTLIGIHGILTANDGQKLLSDSFSQVNGKNVFSQSGGTNKGEYVSVSAFNTEAFKHYSMRGISFLIPKIKIEKQKIVENPPKTVMGECHIKDSIPSDKIYSLGFPSQILQMSISNGIGNSVLDGTSDFAIKCQSFIKRIELLFGKDDSIADEIIKKSKELDNLYLDSSLSNPDRLTNYAELKNVLEKLIGDYFKGMVQNKYPAVNSYLDYLKKKELNSFLPIVLSDKVYQTSIQSKNSFIFNRN